MPKETKKFINPLLRPSQQEVEPKQEKPPKQEKSAPAAPVQTNNSQSAHQTGEQEEKSKQTPPDSPRQPAAELESHTNPTNGNLTQSRTSKTAKYSTDSDPQGINRLEHEVSAPEQSRNFTRAYEPQPETLRAHSNQTLIRPETPPYDPHVSTETKDIDAETKENLETQEILDIDESDDDDYDEPEVDFSVTTSKAKRKRGEQAFERTHVRFTVWVDKSLKQSFEDIALQREKPKTTLLNEAIADLVRKYEAP